MVECVAICVCVRRREERARGWRQRERERERERESESERERGLMCIAAMLTDARCNAQVFAVLCAHFCRMNGLCMGEENRAHCFLCVVQWLLCVCVVLVIAVASVCQFRSRYHVCVTVIVAVAVGGLLVVVHAVRTGHTGAPGGTLCTGQDVRDGQHTG